MAIRTFQGKGYVARFDFDRVTDENVTAAKRGLAEAAVYLTDVIKHSLSRPGPLPTQLKGQRRKRREELIAAAGETAQASQPGEPPRYRLGILRATVDAESRDNGMTQRVGTPLKYGYWLEWGTVKMKPRPWLRPALRNYARQITAFVTNAIRG
jgi:hypothetical protein